MKLTIKSTYFFIGLGLMFSACSQEDIPGGPDRENNRIEFSTTLPELTSRAEVITKDNLRYFYVTAFDMADQTLMSGMVMQPLFANERVDIVPGKNSYTSPYCCWPDAGKESHEVSFFGFYPSEYEVEGAELENESSNNSISYSLKGFRVAEDIADQLDFVTAYGTGNMAAHLFSGVELSFAHQLSRIEIKAYGEHKSCDIEIAGVRIGGTGVKGTFDFKPIEGGGEWSGTPERDIVEYIYRKGDRIMTFGRNHPVDSIDAFSIMGKRLEDGNENCAMLIPSAYDLWNHAGDPRNTANKMYISVLVRITDATPTAGQNPAEKQRYPYRDLSHGVKALEIPREYFAVKKASDEVSIRLYKRGDVYDKDDTKYYRDSECTKEYPVPSDEEVREFGWASVPVAGNWKAGYIYTYTLDYTLGCGVHDPAVTTATPGAGDPVISDRVGITYSVKEWKVGGGSDFVVPGS